MVRVDDTFEYVKINVASPEKIKKWSQRRIGNFIIACEVTRPETINYRTFKPEMDGLFCERIFGPVKNWECHCGKYKRIRNKNLICERCGVEITESRIRRHRMAHINLMYPVTHIWYLQGIPSYLTLLLDTTRYKLKRVIYFNDIKGNETLQTSKKLKETNGSDLLIKLLNKLNLKLQINFSRIEIINTSEIRRERLIKRIRILENFLSTGTNPIWMILFVLPILPPGLRPMVQLEGGRFATSDLNELYRRVITRNNRLKRFFEIYAPEIIVRNEKRLLQEAVDALIDNGKCEKKSVGLNTRPLKSLSDILAGKQGRFRQNLLGKRVDYSGRSIIVVDPYLKLNQCGLPYEMAIELFQPFIIYELIYEGLAPNMQLAKKLIGQNSLVLVKLVNKILNGFPILLNRAPTLHRLGIQAFEPKIIEGRAIKLHPLVCPSFNADFDGDQMAIHIPLSIEAQTEAYLLMLAPNNLMALTINEPIVLPSQDIVLGCHYLTILNNKADHPNYYFHDFDAVIVALDHNIINLHSIIWVKYSGPIQFDRTSFFIKSYNIENTISIDLYTNYQIRRNNFGEITSNYILTTPGRIILNRLVSNILIN
jgi:DNA-directed RNA polymerase subunit beta'|tara:strand:- start:703 stop:2490 length:1788 start_codon:yes stop_codon:yes gene_type:complete